MCSERVLSVYSWLPSLGKLHFGFTGPKPGCMWCKHGVSRLSFQSISYTPKWNAHNAPLSSTCWPDGLFCSLFPLLCEAVTPNPAPPSWLVMRADRPVRRVSGQVDSTPGLCDNELISWRADMQKKQNKKKTNGGVGEWSWYDYKLNNSGWAALKTSSRDHTAIYFLLRHMSEPVKCQLSLTYSVQ